MRLGRFGVLFFSLLISALLRSQTSVPVLVQSLPPKLDIGPSGLALDMRDYFVVPGVTGTQLVQFETVAGRFNVELRSDVAPRHVANFLAYVQAGAYTNTFFHQSTSFAPGGVSVVRGGAYGFRLPFEFTVVSKFAPVALEYNVPNTRGTLAAMRAIDPTSATSEWFFNVRDNSTLLSPANAFGGYSVFGRVLGTGMTVVDAIAALPRYNTGSVFTEIPLRNVGTAAPNETNLVVVSSVKPATLFPTNGGLSVVTFSVESGNPNIISGAISGAILRITPGNAGTTTMTVRATDTNGNVAVLAVIADVGAATEPPLFASQPLSQSVPAGATVVLNAAATEAGSYRWEHNGVPVPGATSDTLMLHNVTLSSAGSYVSVATNVAGATRSNPAMVAVLTAPPIDKGRLVNLSILTSVGAGANVLTMGAYVGPGDSLGALPLVIRAVGPTLAQPPYGVANVLPDPVMTFFSAASSNPLETNDDWGGSPALEAAFSAVAAFQLPAASRDSAIVRSGPGVSAGGYTVQVQGKGATSGACIAEIYDASGSSRTTTTPRLINLSTRAQINDGSDLAVGFVIGGNSPVTVLIRGVGPSLSAFGVAGLMEDPRIELFDNRSGRRIAGNDDWAGGTEIASVSASVGAFALRSEASKDAVVVLTLQPGPYSVRVAGVNGAGGVVLVEVYEVP